MPAPEKRPSAPGFVNEVSEGDIMDTARRWAAQLPDARPMPVRITKEAAVHGLPTPLDQASVDHRSYPAMEAMLASENHVERPLAFAQKRAPQWKRR